MVPRLRASGALVIAAVLSTGMTALGNGEMRELVPQPKEIHWSKDPAWEVKEGKAAIVIGRQASEPEALAAELLQTQVAKRFKLRLPIFSKSDDVNDYELMILMGQRDTNARLDGICSENKIDLSPDRPGHDGYVIETLEFEDKKIALVGGSGARGVLYGQDTFFQLFSNDGGKTLLARASIRDWPTVPWRGRPQTHYENYFRPEEWEAYVTARINWIDLRDGIYAFEPGTELDRETIARVIREGHRCGFVVFGTVNCGVTRGKYPDVLKTFGEFISLGVDGLWISFDDKGPGDAAEEIVVQVLELAREHGIPSNHIGICPPKGSYQEIDTDFNRLIAAIPGMEEALWYFTVVPSAQSLADGRAIGLKTNPSWWHNWTRPHSGFTHSSSSSQLGEGIRSYMNVPPLSEGWHSPNYNELAKGGDCVQSIMPWGGNTWGQYYIVPVIGWWGWSPEGHDWDTVRSRIYEIVYGRGQVAAAMEFDDTLVEAESLFTYPWDATEWEPWCPPRLTREQDRGRALELLRQLDELQRRIAGPAVEESMLPPDQVTETYVNPMRREIEAGKTEATLPYPEYWWDEHQRKLLAAVHDGDHKRAEALISRVQDQILTDMERIGKELGYLRHVPDYVEWWKQRALFDVQGWQNLVNRRRRELEDRVWDYGYYQAKTSTMLRDANSPPLGWGTGRWEKQNKVLASVIPTHREYFRGDWLAGVYDATPAAVFAHQRKAMASPGNYSELEVEIPVSGNRGRLALMIFLSNHSKETIGFHYVKTRWAGRHFIQLLWDDRVLWEADLGWPRLEGEWFVVKVPPVPDDIETLRLRLRVEDRKQCAASTIAFVGPIRLVEIPE
jgi:hypothetical protein